MGHGSPPDTAGPRFPLSSDYFAADPHTAYRRMREQFGALAPVELAEGVPATLVLDYRTAVGILNDPQHFPVDPRNWQKSVDASSPVLPMMGWRPNALRSDGYDHARFRKAITAALATVDLYRLHEVVERRAEMLIGAVRGTGRTELIGDYARPLTIGVLNALVGCPEDIGHTLVAAFGDMFDAADAAAAATVEQRLAVAFGELIAWKRRSPGADIASALCEHEVALTDDEVAQQLVTMYSAGAEVLTNLIANTLRLMLTDARFAGSLQSGSLVVRDGLDQVLYDDPPLANLCTTYPRSPVILGGVRLPAHQPVVISIAACNTDPAVRMPDMVGNRAHLAFSTGPHACPAREAAYLIAEVAIDQLLDALPNLSLAAEPQWRPGPFHRSLTALWARVPQPDNHRSPAATA